MKYELPELPFNYDSLEPYIDMETLHYHHDKHLATYTEKFNASISKYPDISDQPVENLLKDLESIPTEIRMSVKNNGGGYLNHIIYFESLSPVSSMPSDTLNEAIIRDFGSIESLKQALSDASLNHFGSGYGWLVKGTGNKLKVYSLPNQDSPYSLGEIPLLPIDVWEHAYYLKYKNVRKDYLDNIWNVINWEKISERFSAR